MSTDNIKVAIRVRPFTDREKDRNATLIVRMIGKETIILHPQADPKDLNDSRARKFLFDYSYWSHDGFRELPNGYTEPEDSNSPYCDQKRIFSDLGEGILRNALEGYNSTLFAYGQTGSGKSYSVIGYGKNRGIVPLFCDRLFQSISRKTDDGTKHEVMFSMLEIYRETARDLLSPKGSKLLQIHENKEDSFYAGGLSKIPVANFDDIDAKLTEGAKNRTIAATNMNATSSRSHVVVTIWYTQKYIREVDKKEMVRKSNVNLVDLAGSEQTKKTGASGDRLMEANKINLSLTTLGRVIAALADQSHNKATFIPYRESVLTKLLKNSLGGNNKTVMIAAISPADINYDESLSTLRFADGAKRVKTRAKVKEDPTDKLIRELYEENEKLKLEFDNRMSGLAIESKQMSGVSAADMERIKQQAYEEYQANLLENQKKRDELERSFQERLAEAYAKNKENLQNDGDQKVEEAMKTFLPYIYNINQDEQLTGQIEHFVTKEKVKIGRAADMDIRIQAASIADAHAQILMELDQHGVARYYVEKIGDSREYRTYVDGEIVKPNRRREIRTNSRILFGTAQLFVFVNPKQEEEVAYITYDMAMNEIAIRNNYNFRNTDNKKDAFLQEEIIELKGEIEDANGISHDLEKLTLFELAIIPGAALGDVNGKTELWVAVKNLSYGYEWLWPQEKFRERKAMMDEMYKQFQNSADKKKRAPSPKTDNNDPFWDDPDADILIGYCKFKPLPLAFRNDIVQTLDVMDLKGHKHGRAVLKVEMHPCDAMGRDLMEPEEIQDSRELLNKRFHFNFKIIAAKHLMPKYKSVYVKYKLMDDADFVATPIISDKPCDPHWNYVRRYDWQNVEEKHLHYLQQSIVPIQVWGRIDPVKAKKRQDLKADLKQLVKEGMTLPIPDSPWSKVIRAAQAISLQSASNELYKLRRKMKNVDKLIQEFRFHQKHHIPLDELASTIADDNDENKPPVEKNPNWRKIFISYAWDRVTHYDVRKFARELKNLNRYNVWIDETDMQFGDDINEQMAENIKSSDMVMIFFNNQYQNRKNCKKEATLTDRYGKHVLFVNMQKEVPQQPETKLKWEPWFEAIILNNMFVSYYKEAEPHPKILAGIERVMKEIKEK